MIKCIAGYIYSTNCTIFKHSKCQNLPLTIINILISIMTHISLASLILISCSSLVARSTFTCKVLASCTRMLCTGARSWTIPACCLQISPSPSPSSTSPASRARSGWVDERVDSCVSRSVIVVREGVDGDARAGSGSTAVELDEGSGADILITFTFYPDKSLVTN